MSEPHSAANFGPQRDHWWNPDFLELMVRRWRLAEAESLADIGCGVGHWTRLLYPHCRPGARYAGVDREPRWVAESEVRFRQAFPDVPAGRATFHQADAVALPLPSDSFDVVTCQTLLMHLARPDEALREMRRILKPGGLLICAEPNNFWGYLNFTSLSAGESVETLTVLFEFWLRSYRGRIAEGKGDHAFGDLLPGSFAQLGLRDIRVHLNDRASALYPPYDQPAQQAFIEQERRWHETQTAAWDKAAMRCEARLGGVTDEMFERVWAGLEARYQSEQAALAAGTWHAGFGGVFYLVSGRKP